MESVALGAASREQAASKQIGQSMESPFVAGASSSSSSSSLLLSLSSSSSNHKSAEDCADRHSTQTGGCIAPDSRSNRLLGEPPPPQPPPPPPPQRANNSNNNPNHHQQADRFDPRVGELLKLTVGLKINDNPDSASRQEQRPSPASSSLAGAYRRPLIVEGHEPRAAASREPEVGGWQASDMMVAAARGQATGRHTDSYQLIGATEQPQLVAGQATEQKSQQQQAYTHELVQGMDEPAGYPSTCHLQLPMPPITPPTHYTLGYESPSSFGFLPTGVDESTILLDPPLTMISGNSSLAASYTPAPESSGQPAGLGQRTQAAAYSTGAHYLNLDEPGCAFDGCSPLPEPVVCINSQQQQATTYLAPHRAAGYSTGACWQTQCRYPATTSYPMVGPASGQEQLCLGASCSSEMGGPVSRQHHEVVQRLAVSEEPEVEQELKVCEWEGCEHTFLDMQEFVRHLEDRHVNQEPREKNRYFCLWSNCKRNAQEFNARYKLLIHMRVHSGEKPYLCNNPSCTKSFSRLENLKIHQRSHTGEKPYKCNFQGCLKSFTNSSDRIKHHKTHKDPKPYSCNHQGCAKRYTDPSSLRKHLRAHKRIAGQSSPRADHLTMSHESLSFASQISGSLSSPQLSADRPMTRNILGQNQSQSQSQAMGQWEPAGVFPRAPPLTVIPSLVCCPSDFDPSSLLPDSEPQAEDTPPERPLSDGRQLLAPSLAGLHHDQLSRSWSAGSGFPQLGPMQAGGPQLAAPLRLRQPSQREQHEMLMRSMPPAAPSGP